MKPYYSDSWLTVYQGDCREVMASMEPASVHCVVTSPPYWGLRDYGTATWVGGDEACSHAVGGQVAQTKHPAEGHATGQRPGVDASQCRRCGAIREDGQLGLEPTPEAYVENMVAVFREVRRVLRDDGTVWLNLGDSYNASPPGNKPGTSKDTSTLNNSRENLERRRAEYGTSRAFPGLKPKDLVGIPWRVAFALQADGWYLRSDIIWAKPNPMPESVTDRPTKSHEYLFLLSKSARYHYDAKAVAEPAEYSGPNGPQHSPYGQGFTRRSDKQAETAASGSAATQRRMSGFNDRWDAKERATWAERKAAGAHPGGHGGGDLVGTGTQRNVHGEGMSHDLGSGLSRNLRSVWNVATQPYPGAHFATFPPKLVEPCVKAGCPSQVCSECGTAVEYDDAVPVQSVRSDVQSGSVSSGSDAVLLARVRDAREDSAGQGVPGVRDELPRAGSVLWSDVREQSNGSDATNDQGVRSDSEGLRPPVSAGPSDGDADGLRGGTSAGDGRSAGPDAAPDRGRGSHQHDQGRQPAGEPPRLDEEGSRRPVEPGPRADGDLSRLREPLPASRQCRQCGSDLTAPGATRPGVVLDLFAGSGTTGMVAQRLGRRAVLIDLNGDYLVQAMARNVNIPLGLDVA